MFNDICCDMGTLVIGWGIDLLDIPRVPEDMPVILLEICDVISDTFITYAIPNAFAQRFALGRNSDVGCLWEWHRNSHDLRSLCDLMQLSVMRFLDRRRHLINTPTRIIWDTNSMF